SRSLCDLHSFPTRRSSDLTDQRRLNTRDYRLFDIQHAVLPTKLPLPVFYRELLNTQRVLYRKHLSWRTAPAVVQASLGLLMRGRSEEHTSELQSPDHLVCR